MNAIRSVFNAFTNLAAAVNALAGVIDAASARLRQQLALDEAGHVLEHHSPAAEEEPSSSAKRGKKSV